LPPKSLAPAPAPADPSLAGLPYELTETDLTSPFFTARHEALSPDQENAMEALRRGGTIAEAARAADVSRMTVYRWVKDDPHFRAIYRQWQDEVRHSARARLMSLTYKAVTTVQKSIEAGDGKLALQMLKHLGALLPAENWQMEQAMTDPKLVERIDAVHKKQIAEAVRKEEEALIPRQKKRGKNSPAPL
jgi:AcrR family transcriptional regulator